VAILQNKKKTNKRVARSIKTAEGEIRELVTQKYTSVVKPKLEEGIGGGGVAAAAEPEPTPKQKERRGVKERRQSTLLLLLFHLNNPWPFYRPRRIRTKI
jgi:hypothetical protein